MTLRTRVARLMCCPGGTCIKPEDCDMGRTTVVNIPQATDAVIAALPVLLCERWRNDGPMVVRRRVERDE